MVVLGFFLLGSASTTVAACWLVIASLVFYGWWNPIFVPLLVGSILFNFTAGRLIARSANPANKRRLTIVAIVADLALLGYFKYADFFVSIIDSAASADLPYLRIVLPLGISFFTFTQIAFLVDVYRGYVREYRLDHYALFVSYFPHLIAGPILHHSQMMPQFADRSKYRPDKVSILHGLSTFLIGLAKKVVIADGLAQFVGPVFTAADGGQIVTFLEGWAGALGYTFQLYFDFSGYTDMAIGVSLLFGIALPLNFASPYKSANIIEFWRRWHITLSHFLRDYLYIPLGGNRLGEIRRYGNLFATMALGGLWHGANWTFVYWGMLHGSYLAVCHLWGSFKASSAGRRQSRRLVRLKGFVGTTLTFLCVVVAWVVFRAETLGGAWTILKGMAGRRGLVIPEQLGNLIPHLPHFVHTVGRMPLLGQNSVLGIAEELGLILIAAALCWCFPPTQKMGPRLRFLAISLSFAFVVQGVFYSRAPSPFLYFQF